MSKQLVGLAVMALVTLEGLGHQAEAAVLRWRADVQLIDPAPSPDDVLPPGPPTSTIGNVIIDTGSPFTVFDLNSSVQLGLGTFAAGPPPTYTANNAYLDPAQPTQIIGGVGGGAVTLARTRAMDVNAGGLGRPLVQFQTVSGLHVLNPAPINLIGGDFIQGLPAGQSLLVRKDGSATFFGTERSPSAPFEIRNGPFEGTQRWVLPAGVVSLQGPAGTATGDFTIVSGSETTIIGAQLASQLGLLNLGTFALDQESQALLYFDGFISETTTSLISSELSALIVYTNLEVLNKATTSVLINPFSNENVFGADSFFFKNNGFLFDVPGRKVFFVPEPGSEALLIAAALSMLLVRHSPRKVASRAPMHISSYSSRFPFLRIFFKRYV